MEVDLVVEEEGSGDVEEKTVEVEGECEAGEILESAGINPESVIVERDGAIIPSSAEMSEEGELRVLRVISGG